MCHLKSRGYIFQQPSIHAAMHRDWLILAAVSLLALFVRLWGIHYGLPHTEAVPDESIIVNTAVKFGTGDFNPHFFLYPTLYMYMLFALFGGYYIVGLLTGKYPTISVFQAEFVNDPVNFYLIGRSFSAFLGTATVIVTYVLARRCWGQKTANVAALYLSLAYLNVRESHFIKTDTLMVFIIDPKN